MIDPAAARYLAVNAGRGHYESWYIKAGEPGGSRALWIRYTVHKRPSAEPEASVWMTLFDRSAGRPFAVKQTAAPGELESGGELLLGAGPIGRIDALGASGKLVGAGREASWELQFDGGEEPLLHLPERLYTKPLPRTKLLTLRPALRISGQVSFGDDQISLASWPGMFGHNWGVQHAEQWVWLHGASFEGRGEDSWLDVGIGRVKIGRWTTPWIANGAISLDGERHRLGGIGAIRRTHVEAKPGLLTFDLPGGLAVSGKALAPETETVAWIYSDPDGSEHNTLNCSIADLELSLTGGTGEPTELRAAGSCVYEYGSRETDHGVPVEPFADG